MLGVLSTLNWPLLPRLLKAILANGVQNVCVIADRRLMQDKDLHIWRERTAKRFEPGGELFDDTDLYSPALAGIPFYLVDHHNHIEHLIARLDVKVLLNGGTPRKLSQALLDAVPWGVVNVHPGVLPKYRGSSCVEWAIHHNEAVGNTAHFMVADYDAGPIIFSETYRFQKPCCYEDIRCQVYLNGVEAMARAAAMVVRGEVRQSSLPPQAEGICHPPIPQALMATVRERVEQGQYAYVD